MNTTAKQFENKNLTISPNGLILRGGRSRVEPITDKETGLKYFEVFDASAKNKKRRCCLHVEVFRLYSGIPNIPRLKPEDVEFIEGNRIDIGNLKLSESGMKRVYGSNADSADFADSTDDSGADKQTADGKETDGVAEPAETTDEEASTSDAEATEGKDGDDVAASSSAKATEDKDSADADEAGDSETDAVAAVPVVAFKENPKSSFYTVEDSAGNPLNDGKKINGQAAVEKWADEQGYAVDFVEKK